MSDKNFKVKSGLNLPITSATILATDSTGNLFATSVLPITAGGTGQTSATNAINALLPVQNGSTVNYALKSDGVNVNWSQLYYQTIKNAGVTVTPRPTLNIVGASFSDDAENGITTISLGGLSAVEVSSNITLSNSTRYFVNTSSARTLTLPASPSLNDEIQIFDASGTANTYNITVSRNGNLINGNAGNLIIDVAGGWYTLVYTGSTYGWKVG